MLKMTEYNKKERFLIVLDSFVNIEYKYKREIFDQYKGKTFLEELATGDIFKKVLSEEKYLSLLKEVNKNYEEKVFSNLEKEKVLPITIESPLYPEELKEVPCPPLVLYAKGNTDLLKNEKFSIIGSRKSSPFAVKKAVEFAEEISAAGFTIVTGIAPTVEENLLAFGIKSGNIITVIASGFNEVYPKNHQTLLNKVAENGLAISEYPPDTPTEKFRFIARNRILAGLSKGLLVVSGAKKSGTFTTAEFSDDLSRPVFAFPYSLNDFSGEGCNKLIKEFAYLTETPEDVLSYYNKTSKKEEKESLSEEEKLILKILESGETHIDVLCEKTNKKSYEIVPVLSMLEIKKLIVKTGGNKYSRL